MWDFDVPIPKRTRKPRFVFTDMPVGASVLCTTTSKHPQGVRLAFYKEFPAGRCVVRKADGGFRVWRSA